MLVPNLKQEQPRIIFDAFSQGVPVIASDTSGILDVTDQTNAITFKSGDSTSLSDVLLQVIQTPSLSQKLGFGALKAVQGKTHQQMHLDRQQMLEKLLDPC